MGVMCEINVKKSPDETFKPSEVIKGAVRYAVNKNTIYHDIVIAFKGIATCFWKTGSGKNRRKHHGTEEICVIKKSLLPNKHKESVPMGMYTVPFEFELAPHLPPSFKKNSAQYHARGRIKYYISITFIGAGAFGNIKKFKRKILIDNPIIHPIMPGCEIQYACEKKPTHIFSNNDKSIKVKASIANSIISPGGSAQIMLTVQNDSKVNIKEITTNLIEVLKYKSDRGRTLVIKDKIRSSNSKIQPINAGDSENVGIIVPTKTDMHILKTSKIIDRSYYIYINTKLPLPHRNFIVRIPVEIINANEVNTSMVPVRVEPSCHDQPPSYWEIMKEPPEKSDLNY